MSNVQPQSSGDVSDASLVVGQDPLNLAEESITPMSTKWIDFPPPQGFASSEPKVAVLFLSEPEGNKNQDFRTLIWHSMVAPDSLGTHLTELGKVLFANNILQPLTSDLSSDASCQMFSTVPTDSGDKALTLDISASGEFQPEQLAALLKLVEGSTFIRGDIIRKSGEVVCGVSVMFETDHTESTVLMMNSYKYSPEAIAFVLKDNCCLQGAPDLTGEYAEEFLATANAPVHTA